MSLSTHEALINAILQADIQGVIHCLRGYNEEKQHEILSRAAYGNVPVLTIFTIQSYVGIKKQFPYYTYASMINLFKHCFSESDGVSVAIHFLNKNHQSSLLNSKWLLSLNDFPKRYVRKKEAIRLARRILSHDPHNEEAQIKLLRFNKSITVYSTLENDLKLALAKADLRGVHKLLSNYQKTDIFGVLIDLAKSVSEIAVYTYLASHLIKKPKDINMYNIASGYLNFELLYVNAYSIAVHYDRQVLALQPDNIENKISLASYATMPDKLVKKKEAIKLAKDILKQRPKSYVALDILYGHRAAHEMTKSELDD